MKKSIVISLIIAVLTYILFSFDAFSVIDNKYLDQRFKSKRNQNKPSQIVILAIDDYSIDKFSIWPWPRSIYSRLIKVLDKEGAKTIAFDVSFDSYTSYNKIHDMEFGEAIKAAGNVVLAREVQVKHNQVTFLDPIPELKKYALMGIVHPHLDSDYFIRRYNILALKKGEIYPYFAFAVVSKYLDIPINHKTVKLSKSQVLLNNIKIPLDKKNKMLINYIGKRGSFSTIPIYKVFEENFLKNNPDLFSGKIVLIGATAKYLQDLYPTPTSLEMPGVEIHANAIETILSKKHLHTIPHLFYFVLILLPALIITFITKKFNAITGLVSICVFTVLLIVSSRIAFKYLYIFHIFSPIFAIFATYLSGILLRFLQEEFEKKEIRSIFNQYVSPSIVHELLTDKTKLNLGGEKREVSIFFSDIISFTTFSETHEPEEIISQLNEYLNAMTEVIFEYKGTLDKFVGDEIMAVWGTPLAQADHAILAVKCALKQLDELRKLQEKWKAEGKEPLDIGMGINSGEVIAGNIGADKYKDYTVIGDAVNLGARLEAYTRTVTKERGKICHFIISDYTKKLVEDQIETQYLGEIKVKGKNIAVKIWEVIGEKDKSE